MPMISIITPVYNAGLWLPDAIHSAQKQTLRDWEMLLIDDCSTDDSLAIAQKLSETDHRISIYRTDCNVGPNASRALALKKSQGRFVAFLDADDLWVPEKLEKCIQYMSAHGYGFVYHDCKQFYSVTDPCQNVLSGPDELNMRTLYTRRGVRISMVVIDKSIVGDAFISESIDAGLHEDLVMWLNIVRSGHVGRRLPESLGLYRLVKNSRDSNKIMAAIKVWRIYRDISKLSLHEASCKWIQYGWNSLWQWKAALPRKVSHE